jgi:hypothetical protein
MVNGGWNVFFVPILAPQYGCVPTGPTCSETTPPLTHTLLEEVHPFAVA